MWLVLKWFFGNCRDFAKVISRHCDTQAKQSSGKPVFSRLLHLRIAMTASFKTTGIPEEPIKFHFHVYNN